MTTKDTSLYGLTRHRRLQGDKEISSNTALSFSSQLGSLINSSPSETANRKPASAPRKPKKDDLFHTHNRNSAKRARRDLEDPNSSAFATEQRHTTDGEPFDRSLWERIKRNMEEKARLYAAMKRGDVEDEEERYAVDFDRKWAVGADEGGGLEDEDSGDEDEEDTEQVQYEDEFGRTRTGSRGDAARAEKTKRGQTELSSDRFTARPQAPSSVIYGDTIQHHAFNPDARIEEQMAALAEKRDKSLTPPPEEHFDASREVRTKGTGFFRFSADAEERKRQMEALERERAETERTRREMGNRKAEAFLDELGAELDGQEPNQAMQTDTARHGAQRTVTATETAGEDEDAMARLERQALDGLAASSSDGTSEPWEKVQEKWMP